MSVRSIVLVTAPLMLGLFVMAEPFIKVVFGDQWLPAVPFLQVLCFVGLLLPINNVNVSVLKAQGHAKLNFRLNIIKKLIGIVLLVGGSYFGAMGVAYSFVIQSFIALFIKGITKKNLGYSMTEQLGDRLSSTIISVSMALFIFMLEELFGLSRAIELLLFIFLGSLFYLACNIVFKNSAFKEVVTLMKRKENKNSELGG